MATNTPNLNLYKKNPVTDGEDVFNIETMLNENWDKIDTAVKTRTDAAEENAKKASIPLSQKGANNGVATLDNEGRVQSTDFIMGSKGRIASLDALSSIASGGILQQTSDSSGNGYGLWQCANCYYNGSNWIQIRGDQPSYAMGVIMQKKFTFRYAAPSGSNGSVITMTEIGMLNGNGEFSFSQFKSSAANGTAPMVTSSQTKVTNFHADLVDGYHASITVAPSTIAVRDTDNTLRSGAFIAGAPQGVAPFQTSSTTLVSNFNAEFHGGKRMGEIANGILTYAGATAGTSTGLTASVTSGVITSLVAGDRISFKAHVATSGAVTLNLNGLGAKPIKKPNGNNPNLALNGVYTVIYDGSAFILQGEGGEYGNATADKVLAGTSFGTENGLSTGTMPNRGAVTITPSATAQTIAAGYHNGSGKVSAVTFDDSKVLTGTTIAGTAGTLAPKLTNLINNGSFENGLTNGWTYADLSSYGIASSSPKFGSKNLAVACDASKTEGFAFQNVKYISGHTYYVSFYAFSSRQFTMDVYFPLLSPYYPSAIGLTYSSANLNTWTQMSAVITTNSEIPSQTAQIRIDFNNNKTDLNAWMDGVILIDLTETFGAGKEPDKATMDAIIQANGGWWDSSLELMTSDANATSAQILNGYTAYVNGEKVRGNIPIRTGVATEAVGVTLTDGGDLFLNTPDGFYNPVSSIHINEPSLANTGYWRSDVTIFGKQGTLTARGSYTAPVSAEWNGYDLYVRIPQGAYVNNGGAGYPEIQIPATLARADGNISAGNIRSGVWIYGVQGTLDPKKYASGTVWGNPGSIVVAGLGFRPLIFHCYIASEYSSQSSNEFMYKEFNGSLFSYNRMNIGGYNQSIASDYVLSDDGFTITSYYDQITTGTYTWQAWG